MVELLVSVMIFIVISGMLLAQFRRSARADAVRAGATLLAAHVQELQAFALGSVSAQSAIAYGIVLDLQQPDRYIRFGDRADGGVRGAFDVGEELDGGIVALDGVRITALTPAHAATILMTPPLGRVTIMPDAAAVVVTLTDTTGDRSSVVRISRVTGQATVE